MSISDIIFIILLIGIVIFFLSISRAKYIESRGFKMHSRYHYYGAWSFFICLIPSLSFLLFWNLFTNIYIDKHINSYLSSIPKIEKNNIVSIDIIHDLSKILCKLNKNLDSSYKENYFYLEKNLKNKGILLPNNSKKYILPIVIDIIIKKRNINFIGNICTIIIAFIGGLVGFFSINVKKRARNKVECLIIISLFVATTVAVLTTISIILSLLFQTVNFFQLIPLSNFFFGTFWDPYSSSSEGNIGKFGLLPLFFGTIYIAFISMFFAIPIGLFSAIYTAEYADSKVRNIIKPLLEILAGIPTIVYGFFSLITVGPLLRDISIAISGGKGFILAQSVLTAGIVMGIMLIPFVSSLSDDIITAVPRSLRDASFGLGATRYETIIKVILPSAWPGIIAALLLTASRAIGETMIVVLATGVAAKITFNPFDSMTTITVKIVNQLTGDFEFNSPQTLVAFALGMTLFILTLFMNIFALYIIRKYRETYE